MDCLGFVDGCCCPHYDGEKDRKPYVKKLLMDSKVDSCYSLDDGSALHYKNGKIHKAVSFYMEAHAYQVTIKDGGIYHQIIKNKNLI